MIAAPPGVDSREEPHRVARAGVQGHPRSALWLLNRKGGQMGADTGKVSGSPAAFPGSVSLPIVKGSLLT